MFYGDIEDFVLNHDYYDELHSEDNADEDIERNAVALDRIDREVERANSREL